MTPVTQTRGPAPSLLMAGAPWRLGLALVLIAVLWAAVAWAALT